MKVEVLRKTRDGSTDSIVLKFENGLCLQTEGGLMFRGEQRNNEIKQQVIELLQTLGDSGFQVDGSPQD